MKSEKKEKQQEEGSIQPEESQQPQPAPPPDAELGDGISAEEYLKDTVIKNLTDPFIFAKDKLVEASGEFAEGFQGKSEKTTIPGILGNVTGGFLVEGAYGTVKDMAELVTHLPEAADGMGNTIKNIISDPGRAAIGMGNDFKNYINENLINATPNEWAREAGSIGFELALAVVTSGLGKGAETGAKGAVTLAKEGVEETAQNRIKEAAKKEAKEILQNAVEEGAKELLKGDDEKNGVEIVRDIAKKIEEQNAGKSKRGGKVGIHKNKATYLEQVDAIIALMEKDGIPKDSTFQSLYDEYSKKGGKYDYNKKEIAGAYYKYTGKMDEYLDEIDYDRILADAGNPVTQDHVADDEVKNHAHHICYKRGNRKRQKEWVKKGHKILREYGIDPVLDPHNLVPAPNTGHSLEEIKAVVEDLERTRKKALDECKQFGIKGAEKDLYVKNELYKSLKKSGEKAQRKDPKKKGKKKK